jgi:beta-lactamase class A
MIVVSDSTATNMLIDLLGGVIFEPVTDAGSLS